MTIPPSSAENGLVVIVVVGVVVVVVGRLTADETGPLTKMLVLYWPTGGGGALSVEEWPTTFDWQEEDVDGVVD